MAKEDTVTQVIQEGRDLMDQMERGKTEKSLIVLQLIKSVILTFLRDL